MEKPLWMVQRQRANCLPGISDAHLALQIIYNVIARTNWNPATAHLHCARDRMRKVWEKKAKEIHLLGDIMNVFVCLVPLSPEMCVIHIA